VYDAQNIVAVAHGAHHHAEGKEVEDLVQLLVLVEHLAVDGIGVLHPPVDNVIDFQLVEPGVDLLLRLLHEEIILLLLDAELGYDFVVAHGIQILQREILQLPLDALHAQTMGDGGVDLHGFQRFLLLLFRRLILHGAHVVQTVGDFDQDDPDVLGHGDKHFPQIFHLLVFLGGILNPGQLADPVHQIRHGGTEQLGDFLVGGGGILNAVVHQGGLNGLGVQLQLLRHNLRHSQRMNDIGLAALALLTLMVLLRVSKGTLNPVKVGTGVIGADGVLQNIVLFLNGHCTHLSFDDDDSVSRIR
jgi:hypothetical protein